jgi:hypothetical protein
MSLNYQKEMKVNVEQIIAERRKLEAKLANAVNEFESATKLIVREIDFRNRVIVTCENTNGEVVKYTASLPVFVATIQI